MNQGQNPNFNPNTAGQGTYQNPNPGAAGQGGYQTTNPGAAGQGGYQTTNPGTTGQGGYQNPYSQGYQPPRYQPPVQPVYQQPANPNGYNGDPKYKPLSPWAYFGYNLLFAIPLVGFIMLIVYSFSDDNINRRNYARSFWCAALVGVVVSVVVGVIMLIAGFSLGNVFRNMTIL